MVKCGCLADSVIEMVLLKCAFMATGETSVMMTGIALMLEYSVISYMEKTHVRMQAHNLFNFNLGV